MYEINEARPTHFPRKNQFLKQTQLGKYWDDQRKVTCKTRYISAQSVYVLRIWEKTIWCTSIFGYMLRHTTAHVFWDGIKYYDTLRLSESGSRMHSIKAIKDAVQYKGLIRNKHKICIFHAPTACAIHQNRTVCFNSF